MFLSPVAVVPTDFPRTPGDTSRERLNIGAHGSIEICLGHSLRVLASELHAEVLFALPLARFTAPQPGKTSHGVELGVRTTLSSAVRVGVGVLCDIVAACAAAFCLRMSVRIISNQIETTNTSARLVASA